MAHKGNPNLICQTLSRYKIMNKIIIKTFLNNLVFHSEEELRMQIVDFNHNKKVGFLLIKLLSVEILDKQNNVL
jgi:hypothetical protein